MKIFKKEKEVADLALEYLDTATRCVATGENAVLAYLNGELTDAATAQKETAELESAADAMRRLIADRLFSGAYLPLMRGDIFKVIEVLDKMPNAAESCSAFFVAQKPQVPEEMHQAFVDLTTESFGSMKDLRRAVKAFFKPKGDIEKIRDCARNVSVLESSVDDKEWELTLAIFESETLDLSHKRHLQYAVDRIVHLSDIAENVADRLELAAMKSVL